MTTPEQLAAWRQLADAAPWEFWQQDDNEVLAWQDDEKYYERIAKCQNDDTAAFIAAARQAVPMLLDEVERLQGEVYRWSDEAMKAELARRAQWNRAEQAAVERDAVPALLDEVERLQALIANVPTSNIICLAQAGVRPDDSRLVESWAHEFFEQQP